MRKKEVCEYTANTKPGEKKNVAVELPNAYSPKYVESTWYEWWQKSGFFRPEYKHDLRFADTLYNCQISVRTDLLYSRSVMHLSQEHCTSNSVLNSFVNNKC